MRKQTTLCLTVLAASSVAMLACASRPLTGHDQAWELIDESANMQGIETDAQAVAATPMRPRQAVWLNPYDRSYYAQTPTAQAIAARRAQAESTQHQPSETTSEVLTADARNPTGWSHAELVERWGAPQRIEGSKWIYRSSEGRCGEVAVTRVLEMRDGVVALAKTQRGRATGKCDPADAVSP